MLTFILPYKRVQSLYFKVIKLWYKLAPGGFCVSSWLQHCISLSKVLSHLFFYFLLISIQIPRKDLIANWFLLILIHIFLNEYILEFNLYGLNIKWFLLYILYCYFTSISFIVSFLFNYTKKDFNKSTLTSLSERVTDWN